LDKRVQWDVRVQGRPAREIRFPIQKENQTVGEVRVGYTLARVDAILRRLAYISLVLSLVLMFAMWRGLLWVLRRQIVRPVAQSATELSSASEHLGRLSRDMASFAAETSDLAAASSQGTDNATQTGKTILVQTTQINDGLRSVLEQTRVALSVAQDAVRFMDETNASIARLGRASAEIETLIKSITKIAGQTNLLSLNATIEAARAGEAGHGFSVVAKEVKELANETARAAEDVRPRVRAIQNDIKTAVTAVNEAAAIMRKISGAQENIAAAVQQQASGTDNIKSLVETAAEKNIEILANASTVSEKARGTSAGAQETLKAAEDLERLARELHARVSIF
jgi:methyl-accepting chemotaxis protein